MQPDSTNICHRQLSVSQSLSLCYDNRLPSVCEMDFTERSSMRYSILQLQLQLDSNSFAIVKVMVTKCSSGGGGSTNHAQRRCLCRISSIKVFRYTYIITEFQIKLRHRMPRRRRRSRGEGGDSNGSPLGAARHNIKMHKLQLSQSGLTDQWPMGNRTGSSAT